MLYKYLSVSRVYTGSTEALFEFNQERTCFVVLGKKYPPARS